VADEVGSATDEPEGMAGGARATGGAGNASSGARATGSLGDAAGVDPATAGYFHPGASWLHRRNPLTKLLGLLWVLLAAFLLPPAAVVATALAVLLLAAACGRFAGVLRSLRIPALLVVSIVAVNALFFPGGRDVLASLGPFALTREGLEFGLLAAGRLLVAFAASVLFLQTTLPDDLLEALVARGASHRIAWVVLSAMQAVPRLQATAATILEAQQARGLVLTGSLAGRTRALVPLVGPIIVGSLLEVRDRTLALEARGFGAGRRRTAYRVVSDPPIDRWLRLLIALGMIGVVIVAAAAGR
jgi:energy-coupling factor transport system permease protein